MNRRMPNGTSVWCGRTAGVIPPPTDFVGNQRALDFLNKNLIANGESVECWNCFPMFSQLPAGSATLSASQ